MRLRHISHSDFKNWRVHPTDSAVRLTENFYSNHLSCPLSIRLRLITPSGRGTCHSLSRQEGLLFTDVFAVVCGCGCLFPSSLSPFIRVWYPAAHPHSAHFPLVVSPLLIPICEVRPNSCSSVFTFIVISSTLWQELWLMHHLLGPSKALLTRHFIETWFSSQHLSAVTSEFGVCIKEQSANDWILLDTSSTNPKGASAV